MADFIGLMMSWIAGFADLLMWLLSGISLTMLTIAPWALGGVVVVTTAVYGLRQNGKLTASLRSKLQVFVQAVKAVRAGLRIFVVVSVGAFGYILFTATDPRWSDKPGLSAIELGKIADGGMLAKVAGPYNATMDTLNGFMDEVTNSLNDVIAIKAAMATAQPFLAHAAIATVLMLPVWLLIKLVSKPLAKKQTENDEQLFDQRVAAAVDVAVEAKFASIVERPYGNPAGGTAVVEPAISEPQVIDQVATEVEADAAEPLIPAGYVEEDTSFSFTRH